MGITQSKIGAGASSVVGAAAFSGRAVYALAARLAYSSIEGIIFGYTKPGALMMAALQLASLTLAVGVRRSLLMGVKSATALVLGRAIFVFFHAGSAKAAVEGVGAGDTAPAAVAAAAAPVLGSLWDWEPPATDSWDSGAWHVLRSLAKTAVQVQAENPQLDGMLASDALHPSELASRLYQKYCLDEAAPELDLKEPEVPKALVQELAQYLPLVLLTYNASTDAALSEGLQPHGFSLLFATYEADLAAGHPAYYLAVSQAHKELLLAVRGTYSATDVFTDLLAAGEPLDGGRWHCHRGMGRAAAWLGERYLSIVQPLHAHGYRITLAGHSLGAGVAALLCCWLKRRGLRGSRLRCYAYEPPACMDLALSQYCAEEVLCTVVGDDAVPRMCAGVFASLLEDLAALDPGSSQGKLAAAELPASALVDKVGLALGWALGLGRGAAMPTGEGGQAGGQGGALRRLAGRVREAGEEAERSCDDKPQYYDPHVPGRVVYLYRPQRAVAGVPSGSQAAQHQESAAVDEMAPMRMALLSPASPELRRLRLTSHMLADHFVDAAGTLRAFGIGPASVVKREG